MMQRREFITLLGGEAAAWPLRANAQQSLGKVPTIGFLGSLSQSAQSTWTAAFVQRMREHGWIEDRTVVIEYRWAEGRGERFAEIATEFVGLLPTLSESSRVRSQPTFRSSSPQSSSW